MKNYLLVLFITVFAAACINLDVEEDAAKAIEDAQKVHNLENTGVFIHITHGSDDPHRALMGLMMATKMSMDKDVALYLDINAIELVVKDGEPVTYEDHFPPSDEMIRQLLDNGVSIMACQGCMAVMDVTEDMLIDGVSVAEKDKFFNFTEGGILSLDY